MNLWQKEDGTLVPLGASWVEEDHAWNFAVYAKYAKKILLLIYNSSDLVQPIYTFEFDQLKNKSGPIWHCRLSVELIPDACYYAYQVWGPQDNAKDVWHSYDPQKILLDPYAKSVYFPPEFSRTAACHPGSNAGKAPLGVLIGDEDFDWSNDRIAQHGSDLIIYEIHVKGFTNNQNSEVSADRRGTFAGVIEKIPYLKDLGITAVELMPVFQFDPQQGNYWGYMPLNFFSPQHSYCTTHDPYQQRNEFRQMVKELHRAGIEVILDVVYNHTAEGHQHQPIYSFKGFDNSSYYVPSGDPNQPYANFSGCGNTLDANSIIVRKLIVDSLLHWSDQMHVDGFRFDLASIFSLNHKGTVNEQQPPIFGQIRTTQELSNMRMIAEPWDAAGTYQLGRAFPGWLWMQWNGAYRDTLQRFVRGDSDMITEFMTRLYGSSDLFPDDQWYSCRPWQSVNYVSSHDGSSLYDLVSYEEKNNWANGEENRDGGHEFKWNCGHEGDQNVPESVIELRKRQVKNLFTLLLLSNGTPMFRMGDEFLQTQGGNNNPYNQDNEISWLDWSRLQRFGEVHRFVKKMITFRKAHPSLSRSTFWRDDISWYGTEGPVDYSPSSQALAFYLDGSKLKDQDLYVMINVARESRVFAIQKKANNRWRRAIDTSLASPDDIGSTEGAKLIESNIYVVQANSVVVLVHD